MKRWNLDQFSGRSLSWKNIWQVKKLTLTHDFDVPTLFTTEFTAARLKFQIWKFMSEKVIRNIATEYFAFYSFIYYFDV